MTLPPWAKRGFSVVLIAAAFAFLGVQIARNAAELRSFHWQLRPFVLVGSVVLLSGVLFSGMITWSMVLRRFGVRVRVLPLARAWFLSNISRYIPGVVWQFISLAQLGAGAGLTAGVAVTSLLVQMAFTFLGAVLLGIYLIPAPLAGDLAPLLPALRWLAPLSLISLHPAVLRFFLRQVGRVSRKPVLEWSGSWWDALLVLLLASLTWVAYGIAFFFFLRAFVALPASALPAAIAMNALAFVAGYVAFFAPGGLGFKEAALSFLLQGFVPTAVAASLAVAARLWTIAGEAIPALLLLPRYGRAVPSADEEAERGHDRCTEEAGDRG